MGIVLQNPYAGGKCIWLKGNLHTHTTESDGPLSPQATVDEYARRGYDFLMLSDHDRLVDPSGLDPRGMLLIPGNEITAEGPHILHVGATAYIAPAQDRQANLNAIAADSGFPVVCHPNWLNDFCHCRQELLELWRGYLGIEIYNAVVRRIEGSPLATDRWDQLLGRGRKVWGFANDDTHAGEDFGVAWNVAQCDRREPGAVLDAFRRGRFYASTGVEIQEIHAEGATLSIRADNAQRIVVSSDFAVRRHTVDGAELTYTVPEDPRFAYVRIECWGQGEDMAWTQPFYVTYEE